MTELRITVSDGTNFFRIPVNDLDEACADGFYVPAFEGRTIVSNGQELFEIPTTDVPDAEAEGFYDLLVSEADIVESLLLKIAAAKEQKSATITEDIPESLPGFVAPTAGASNVGKPARKRKKSSATTDTPTSGHPPADPATAEPSAVAVVSADAAQEQSKTLAARLHRLLHPTEGQRRKMIVLATNAAAHVAFIFLMAAIFLPAEKKEGFLMITSSFEPENAAEELELQPMELDQPMEIDTSTPSAEIFVDSKIESMDVVDININDLNLSSIAATVDPNAPGSVAMPTGELGGRSKAGRQTMVAKMGGTAASEMAVQKGLDWLKRHQAEDGGWSFDHTGGECKGSCSQPGSLKENCRNAATGMAILAMLGAGNTPFEGEFQETVLRGVQFLMAHSNPVPAGLDLRGQHAGNTGMYTHAIATTALCETLAMLQHETKAAKGQQDQRSNNRQRTQMMRQIAPAAAAAVTFIVNAQFPADGSWGYDPGAAGDTSILGWQVMALKSAAHAEIPFNPNAVRGANVFLNTVQNSEGSYGYRSNTDVKPSTTAIGIVCRMLSGMPRTEPTLKMGVERLSAVGPDRGNMYYNYYATQVMLNYGGDTWTKWNEAMREQLVSTQVRDGHADGSWDLADAHGGVAGRHYMTCLCTMTLEVYYRHLPLYGMPDESDVAEKDSRTDK
jgi:hypothetical protein